MARSSESDWLAVQAGYLQQLKDIAGNLPIIFAGDLFDRWNSSPELINFALEHLPPIWAVPGQHDLPLHNYEDMMKSAFGTLVKVGRINLLLPKGHRFDGFWACGFAWGKPITPPLPIPAGDKAVLSIAVAHAYIWTKETGYPGVDESKRLGAYKEVLKGYDVALFGDNHKPFLFEGKETTVFNHGGFMRRKIDEIDHRPAVGLLMSNGTVELKYLDVSKDKFLPRDEARLQENNANLMADFLTELQKLGASDLDFREALKQYIRTYKVSPGAETILQEALDHDVTY